MVLKEWREPTARSLVAVFTASHTSSIVAGISTLVVL